MSMGNKAKDALMTGANKAKQATGKAVNNAKDKAIENTKQAAVNKADSATEGTISKLKQAYKIAKQVAMFIKRAVQLVLYAIKALLVILTNPVTWWLALAGVLILLLISALNVFGSIEFRYQPGDKQVVALEDITEGQGKKSDSAALTFAQGTKINGPTAVYLGKIFDDNKGNLTYINKEVPSGCDSKCILDKVNSGVWEDIELGAWKAKGDIAKKILEKSIETKQSWNRSETQMMGIIEALKSSNDQGLTGGAESTETSIKAVNNLLSITATEGDVNKAKEAVDSKADSLKESIKKIKKIGQGHCVGRIEGGRGIEDDCSEEDGRSDNPGSIDASDLIEFLEKVSLSNMVETGGGDGCSLATPEMKAGKALAEKNGGADPLGCLMASCDRLVAMALKATKIDTEYPWGAVRHQLAYVQSHPEKWKRVDPKDRKSGDVMIWGDSHTGIYGINKSGQQMTYQASYMQYIPHKAPTSDSMGFDPNNDGRPITYWRFVGKKG